MLALVQNLSRSMSRDEIDDVIARAKKGDVAAFETLYHAHLGRIHALVRRLGGRGAKIDELVQDVFVRAYEKLSTFRGESAFSTWLHRLAVNVVIEEKRSQIRRDARLVRTEHLSEIPVASQARAPIAAVDLERAIAALPDGARTVLVLFDIEGYSHDEIAAVLDITSGTSKSQLHRARALIREALAT